MVASGPTSDVIHRYQSGIGANAASLEFPNEAKRPGDGVVSLLSAWVETGAGERQFEYSLMEPVRISVRYRVHERLKTTPQPNLHVTDSGGNYVFVTSPHDWGDDRALAPGDYMASVEIPGHFLNDGMYSVGVAVNHFEQGLQTAFFERGALASTSSTESPTTSAHGLPVGWTNSRSRATSAAVAVGGGGRMKAVILAGGLGTRISEETHLRPKPMVEIGGRPILWHIMKIYSAHGINDFVICLRLQGLRHQGVLRQLLPAHVRRDVRHGATTSMEVHQQQRRAWRVTLVDTGEETMTGGRLKRVANYLERRAVLLHLWRRRGRRRHRRARSHSIASTARWRP